jgi:hypothetical protein
MWLWVCCRRDAATATLCHLASDFGLRYSSQFTTDCASQLTTVDCVAATSRYQRSIFVARTR